MFAIFLNAYLMINCVILGSNIDDIKREPIRSRFAIVLLAMFFGLPILLFDEIAEYYRYRRRPGKGINTNNIFYRLQKFLFRKKKVYKYIRLKHTGECQKTSNWGGLLNFGMATEITEHKYLDYQKQKQ